MSPSLVKTQVDAFLAKYTPEMARAARATRKKMHALFPRGYEMIYDNYNALVFGFGPSERPSEAILSIAVMPQWVTLCFLQGARLADPHMVMKGSGNQVRNVRLAAPADMDSPRVRDLIDRALEPLAAAFAAAPKRVTVIRSVSAKQRPRRPAPAKSKPARPVKPAKTRSK